MVAGKAPQEPFRSVGAGARGHQALYKDELTPEQAARKLGVTSSTIRSHKKNALDKLKKEMLEDD